MPEFIITTSHDGFNADGLRVPYLVSDVLFKEENQSVMLYAKGISWAKASRGLAVDFSYRESQNGLDIDSYSPSPALLKKRATTRDLSFSVANTNIFTITDNLSKTTALSFTQKCVSCVGQGTLTLAEGNVTLKNEVSGILGSIFNPKPNPTIADLASNADITVIFNNFMASFEFETSIQFSETFNYHILGPAGVGFPGFSIPGLFSIGPSFDPLIVAQLQLFQPVSFTYGFNFSVPDGSGFQIDMIDLANSQKIGFDATTFTPLPFALLNFTPGVNVSIAFRPVISIGVNLLSIDIDPVTVFADIPKYVVGLVPLANVDDNCQPLATNATGGGEHLRLSSDFVLDLGVGAKVQLTTAIAFMPSIPILSNVLFPFSTCLGGFGNSAGSSAVAAVAAVSGGNITKI
ncbi:hypothetical protein MMC30_006863 [Trapelia coarctata]|nr:hypothetical protein [Trapelia coarctata]